jgi:short-subunit dehydrogenase
MLRQTSGKIINVASRDALAGSAGYAAYSASKSAVLRLTESLAAELKPSNINGSEARNAITSAMASGATHLV